MAYNSVSVTTSPTLIASNNTRRQSIIITNTDATNKLYIGPDSSITTSNAIEIPAGGSFSEDGSSFKVYSGDIYGVSTGTISVRYWERTGQ